ncbi:lactoylglutathione lyase [Photobacterium iliopiscarium]|uniref:lactoylglutathione lyase n=1 Tax=Photobacterium iliopiscarium TaxID=56192 RepID=UPI001E3142C5|nr:lactoylglutathione lyase [Photobacterium iliopiscarium]MCD9466505.1 lactoylglutathione lyase [Photobacterium iliopiscarium]MCD9486129.1 lactoylglutathione lyase [Photobacterium iliopiscarium]MCF2243792.1 lactoylglutathione lyase [Photobacterium iliopiscarium]
MEYLHTMVRVSDLDASLDFYCNKLGLVETNRKDSERGRFTLVFLAAPAQAQVATTTQSPLLELTYNWDTETYTGGRNFGHLAFRVDDIYQLCQHLQDSGVTINRPPRDGHMAFVRSPDGISIELLQKGEPLSPAEPWISQANIGDW